MLLHNDLAFSLLFLDLFVLRDAHGEDTVFEGRVDFFVIGVRRQLEAAEVFPVASFDAVPGFVFPDGAVEMADSAVANHLFRIAQEAVHNAIRHSGGNVLTVRLRRKSDGRVVLSIKDNGGGGDWEGSSRRGGLGLSTMEYRARGIGAELTVSGSCKLGTAVECVV